MTPYAHYQAGELDRAIEVLGEELRSKPLDAQRRTFLFELLCFAGLYDRAERQLDVLESQAGNAAAMGILAYRSALHAQRLRESMFERNELPDPKADLAGGGQVNETPFRDLTDMDHCIGNHLELFIAGSYTWVPMKFVQRLTMQKPENLRDLLWARAVVTLAPGAPFEDMGEVFLPVLTPLAHRNLDSAVRLGRVTVWEQAEDGTERPDGQKMFDVDGEDVPLLEVRSVGWNGATEE